MIDGLTIEEHTNIDQLKEYSIWNTSTNFWIIEYNKHVQEYVVVI